jgi:hypothetical protein
VGYTPPGRLPSTTIPKPKGEYKMKNYQSKEAMCTVSSPTIAVERPIPCQTCAHTANDICRYENELRNFIDAARGNAPGFIEKVDCNCIFYLDEELVRAAVGGTCR